MVIDISKLILKKQISWNYLLNWLHKYAGPYHGKGTGLDMQHLRDKKDCQVILEIGSGWMIIAKSENVEGFMTITYYLDVDDDKIGTFFILKWL